MCIHFVISLNASIQVNLQQNQLMELNQMKKSKRKVSIYYL